MEAPINKKNDYAAYRAYYANKYRTDARVKERVLARAAVVSLETGRRVKSSTLRSHEGAIRALLKRKGCSGVSEIDFEAENVVEQVKAALNELHAPPPVL